MADRNAVQGAFWDGVTANAASINEAEALITALLPANNLLGKDILDAGCGAGDYSAAFARLGARPWGFDLSMGSLALAKKKTPQGIFTQASLSALPYSDEAFDVLWVWGVLHYVPQTDFALAEIARVLRPGGIAVIHTLRRNPWATFESGLARVLSKAPRFLQQLMINLAVALLRIVLLGRPAKTSKTLHQKVYERFFVPGDLATFTVEGLQHKLDGMLSVEEAYPPVSDLFGRNLSLTITCHKPKPLV
jgi:ubiquinone/menaquinone biosynthesis C-methylase UbiE